MRDFEAVDSHFNLFWHYSGKPTHEDNVTRALMVVLSSPSGAAEMTRAFLRALRQAAIESEEGKENLHRVVQLCLDGARAVEFNLQEHSEASQDGADEYEPENGVYVICVGLTPHRNLSGNTGEARSSRADAVIRISLRDPVENRDRRFQEVAIAVETKLWSNASWDQVEAHSTHIRPSGPDLMVALPWQKLYRELSKRPSYLDHDPLVADFDEYIARFPRLTGWTGISVGDLDAGSRARRTKLKVEQLAHRLMEELAREEYQPLERQQGGGDFTIRPTAPENRAGNLGVASWAWCSGNLCLKLVVGSKTKKETDTWLGLRNGDNLRAVSDSFERFLTALIRQFPSAGAELKAKYRFYKYPRARTYVFDRWELTGDNAAIPLSALRDMLNALGEIHSRDGSLTTQDFVRAQKNLEESAREKFQEEMSSALCDENEANKWYQFGKFNFMTLIPEKDLVKYNPDEQVEQLSRLVEQQRNILHTVVA